MSVEEKQNALVEEFTKIQDWRDRYRRIIELGRNLPEFPEEHRVDEHIVKGCQNKVWLHAELDEQGHVVFFADSEAQVVRGLVAILLEIYSGQSPDAIIVTPPTFIQDLNLGENLTMNRASGLSAMIRQMKFYALAYRAKQGS